MVLEKKIISHGLLYPLRGTRRGFPERLLQKKVKRTSKLNSAHRHSQSKCPLGQTSYIKRIKLL